MTFVIIMTATEISVFCVLWDINTLKPLFLLQPDTSSAKREYYMEKLNFETVERQNISRNFIITTNDDLYSRKEFAPQVLQTVFV